MSSSGLTAPPVVKQTHSVDRTMTLEPQNCGHLSAQDFRKVEERAKRVKQEMGTNGAHRPLIANDFQKR